MRDLRRKRLKLATGVVVAYTACAIAKAMCFHNANYVDRDVLSRRRIDQNSLMDRLTQLSDRDCRDQLRIGVDAFAKLCRLFRDTGRLGDTLHSSIEEKIARFLLIISHYWKNRTVRFFFMRSGETVSRHFHQVLEVLISLEDHFIKQPNGAQTPLEIETNPRFWPYLKDCVGAIDGSHIRAKVSEHDVKRYRGRKEHPTQNVLAVCTFDLRICYILAGWEGSASDSRILNSAIAKQIDPLVVPRGKFYLVDAGFMLRPGFLAPYRSTRYHLKEYSSRPPENAWELFNHRHSSLRNAIERVFGILKKRFPIMATEPNYSIETQKDLVLACSILHNYLMGVDPDDRLIAQVEQEVLERVPNDEELAPLLRDDEEYRRGEMLRQRIANEMWLGR